MAKDFWDLSDLRRITNRQKIPTPDPRLAQPQDKESRSADPTFNDVPASSWLRGGPKGSPYPGGVDTRPSGERYRTKK